MQRKSKTRKLALSSLVLLVALADASAGSDLASLDVPLTIHEVAGVERQQDACSTGVPLPCGLLRELEGIALFDPSGQAVPAQFRVLERWRDQGEGRGDLSIRWLLVTFLADVPAGGKSVYRLKGGQNPLPASRVKVEDQGDVWKLGGLAFAKDFSRPFQLLLTNPDDKTISAAELPVTWAVWEAGPIRACLKAETPTVPGKFGFIAWIYAYAGQQRWDMTLVLKNTPNETQGPLYFKDFSVVWEPVEIAGAGNFLLGGQWGKATVGRIDTGQSAYLHQDSDGTDQWNTFGKDWRMSPVLDWTDGKSKAKAGLPAFRGYRVMAGGKELDAGDFAAGWAVLNGPQAGSLAAVRDYHQQYPKATEVAPGRIALRLWPGYTKSFGGLHWLDDCTRKWHDLSFRIASDPLSAREAEAQSRALDFPLVAHPPADWYYAAGVLSPSPEHAARRSSRAAWSRLSSGRVGTG